MLLYQGCDCYTLEVGQAYLVSDLPKLTLRKCLFKGLQLTTLPTPFSLLTGLPDLDILRPALSPTPLHASPPPNSG